MASLTVIRPGMLTTIQDLGRWGYQASGVPVAGPMDEYSHRLANRIAGNPDDAATLEITLMGPELEANAAVVCALAGARFEVTVNGSVVRSNEAFDVPAGGRVRVGTRSSGARAALAVGGGFDVEPVFGSRATSLSGGMGPLGGRTLVPGDRLPVAGGAHMRPTTSGVPLPLPAGGARVRVLMGPHHEWFAPGARETLLGSRYTVTPQSNRMGYRLDGPVLAHAAKVDMLSDGTPIGSLQVPPAGQPILLMADRQTTGGYPKIATVITADLPAAGQLAPGDWIRFAPCTGPEAVDALQRLERRRSGRGA
jgi:biotin-dependent carboxylase-like uncharacterized protein